MTHHALKAKQNNIRSFLTHGILFLTPSAAMGTPPALAMSDCPVSAF
ncbi:hypothetical protein ACT3CE_18750 [Marinifilum sp. RC60d5]